MRRLLRSATGWARSLALGSASADGWRHSRALLPLRCQDRFESAFDQPCPGDPHPAGHGIGSREEGSLDADRDDLNPTALSWTSRLALDVRPSAAACRRQGVELVDHVLAIELRRQTGELVRGARSAKSLVARLFHRRLRRNRCFSRVVRSRAWMT